MSAGLRLEALGVLRLLGADGGELAAGQRKHLALLTWLARTTARGAARPVGREELAALFWGERPDENARRSLRQALYQLKRVVGDGLEVEGASVRLAPHTVALDANLFEADVVEGRHADAVARWRGDLLASAEAAGTSTYRAWLDGERARLRRLLDGAMEALVDDAIRRGTWPEAIAHAERWAAERRDEERPLQRLLEALALAGRNGDALAHLAAFAARQRAEDGEPSAGLLAMRARLERRSRPRATVPSPRSAALFTPDMVGRADAFAELTAVWDGVRRGAAAVVLVEGDAGVGRTRFATEFLRVVARDRAGATVLRTQAHAAQGGQPLATARALLAGLRDAPGLLGAPGAALADVGQLVPALREVVRDLPPPTCDAAACDASLARVVEDVAAESPVVLFIDDVHLADAASRRLLHGLARGVGAAPVLLLLTSRPDADADVAVRELPHLARIRLKPLAPAEIEAMLGSMMAMPAAERRALAARIADESGGSPFDVQAIVSALVDEEYLAPDVDGQWRLASDFEGKSLPIPGTVQEAVARRLDRLGFAARETLETAALLGAAADAPTLAEVARRPLHVVTDGLDELVLRRMMRPSAVAGRFEIAHDVIRRVAYERIAPERRDALTARVTTPLPTEGAGTQPSPLPMPPLAPRRRWTTRRVGLVAGAVLVAVALAIVPLVRQRADAAAVPVQPVILVAEVAPASAADAPPAWMAEALPRLIGARLLRVGTVDVIPPDRWRVTRLRAGAVDSLPLARLMDLGERVGATAVVRGRLARVRDSLALSLELHGDAGVQVVRIMAADPLALADVAAVRLLELTNAGRPGQRLLHVETSSVDAYRLFTQSWSAGGEGRAEQSVALLDSAIALDSAFTSAILARYGAALVRSEPRAIQALEAAWRRHGARASPRDRLEWEARSAQLNGEHARAERAARELLLRYPRDPRGHNLLSEFYFLWGRWSEAERVTATVLALDSLTMEAGQGPCASCELYGRLALVRAAMRDWDGAEGAARRWVTLQPDIPYSWLGLGVVQGVRQELDDAKRSMRRALALGGGDPLYESQYGHLLLMARDHAALDSAVARWTASANPRLHALAGDMRAALLRERGRLREARALADSLIAADSNGYPILVLANTRAALGDAGVAGLFRTAINRPLRLPLHGSEARGFAWTRAHEADATAPRADTVHLRALADSIELAGARSYYGRDWLLAHHVRGLIAARGGRHAEAVGHFERARFLPAGWTRTNVELARSYLALGRPRDAVTVLRDAYTGNHDSMGRYVTRIELDWWMARALAAAGQRDSARVYGRHVRRAWAQADPEVAARLAALP